MRLGLAIGLVLACAGCGDNRLSHADASMRADASDWDAAIGDSIASDGAVDAPLDAAIDAPLDASTGQIVASPPGCDFGFICIVDAKDCVATFTNTGATATPITLAITGSDAGEFSVHETTCTSQPLAPGASCTATVRFSPTLVGVRAAALTASTSSGSTATTSLVASDGSCTILHPQPLALSFGSATIGDPTAAQTFTITNSAWTKSEGPMATSLVGQMSGDFEIVADTCNSAMLPAMSQCTIDIRFRPTATGARGVSVYVMSTSGAFVMMSASGTGTP